MSRARRAGRFALPIALISTLLTSSLVAAARRPEATSTLATDPVVTAAVPWPVSTLVISEVQTGGVSASDEFAELANAGSLPVDLVGLELVYVTSSGSTITRKASWPASTILGPGRHLLVANAAGIHAAIADATYSSGFAATGGAVVLRVIGGGPVDAVAWGDATSSFVEGSAAPAPPAGSSIERLPGGSAGNGTDTNDNSADLVIAAPNPQNLASAPTPGPVGSPPPTPGPSPTASPSPTPSIAPSVTPIPTPTATPTPTPPGTATPAPTPNSTPTPTPTPAVTPTPTPDSTSSATPTPVPTPQITAIADARAATDGTVVTIAGTLTTDLGAIDSARNGFVQDASGGIALRLDAALPTPIPAGTTVVASGSLGSYFSLRVLSVTASSVETGATAAIPDAIGSGTGGAGEALEGVRLAVEGIVTEAPSVLADGLGVTIDDGSGPLRLVVSNGAQAGRAIHTGDTVDAVGPLGQRDSSGTGAAGYRLHVVQAADLDVAAAPTPTPTPSPSPTPTPTPTASSTPTPTPSPTASPTPTPTASSTPTPTPTATGTPAPVASIIDARHAAVGSRVTVRGIVTAEAGRLGTPPLIAIQDDTAGIVVRLSDSDPRPMRGTIVEVTGAVAEPYGQTELRGLAMVRLIGAGDPPTEIPVDARTVNDATEAQLVVIEGKVATAPARATSGDFTFGLEVAGGTVRVAADATSEVAPSSIHLGDRLAVSGIVGQRASRKGASDGFRIWVRDADDIVRLSGPGSDPSSSATPSHGSPTPRRSQSSAGMPIAIAAAIRAGSGTVSVEGAVTVRASLLDATGRRIVIQDATAAIEVLLSSGTSAPPPGTRIRVSGAVGRAYGAPRIRADSVVRAGSATVLPVELRVAPDVAQEWRLVRVRGDIVEIHRSGERWQAELLVGGTRVPIIGLSGAAIASSAIVKDRTATIVGVVRRPYPSASDRRFAIVPRSAGDVRIGGPADDPGTGSQPSGSRSSSAGGATGAGGSAGEAAGPVGGQFANASVGPGGSWVEVDLVALAEHVGQRVRVGGLVSILESNGFQLDDGSAVGRVVLEGAAAGQIASLAAGDALAVVGRVERREIGGHEDAVVVVDDPAALLRAGDPVPDPSTGLDPAGPSAIGSADPGALDARTATAALVDPAVPEAGAAGVVLVGIASLAVTLLRRRRARRRLTATVAARLEALIGAGRPALAAAEIATGPAGPAPTAPIGGPPDHAARA